MTQNQIAYWSHLNDLEHWKRQDAETVRHQQEVEAETARHNRYQESLGQAEYEEKARANRASEANYAEKNRVKSLEVDVKREDVAEKVRHNLASENLTQAQLDEKIREALIQEGLADKNFKLNQFKIKEAAEVAREQLAISKEKMNLDKQKFAYETAPVESSSKEDWKSSEEYKRTNVKTQNGHVSLTEMQKLMEDGTETTWTHALQLARKFGMKTIAGGQIPGAKLIRGTVEMVTDIDGNYELRYNNKVIAKSSSKTSHELRESYEQAKETAYSKAKKTGSTKKITTTYRKGYENGSQE